MTDRQANFDRLIEDYDERQLPRVLDFTQHRFVTVERDSVSGTTFVRGHKSLRGACSFLARNVQGCERFIPERVIDLDTQEVHELDVFAFVAPRSVDAVALLLPRASAEFARKAMGSSTSIVDEASMAEHLTIDKIFERALERRSNAQASTDA